MLSEEDARREAEELLTQFTILYPTESLVRSAIRGWATYRLPWFDAHVWAYAHEYGLSEIYSEDFLKQVDHEGYDFAARNGFSMSTPSISRPS